MQITENVKRIIRYTGEGGIVRRTPAGEPVVTTFAWWEKIPEADALTAANAAIEAGYLEPSRPWFTPEFIPSDTGMAVLRGGI